MSRIGNAERQQWRASSRNSGGSGLGRRLAQIDLGNYNRARTTHPTSPLTEDELANVALPQEPVAPVDALAECLARALGELSAHDAAILRACDLEGMTQRHFAEIHGLSLPAAKARLQRARQRLRDRIATACQLRFDADGAVASHVPRPPAD